MTGPASIHRQDAGGAKRKPFSFRWKMLVCFGALFALGLLASGLSSLYGIPFTDYRGEYGLRRAEALRDLNLLADTEKAELLHLITERQGDAATFCDSPIMRKLVSRVCARVQQVSGSRNGLPRLRAALHESADYRLLTEHMSTIKQIYAVQYDKIRLADAVTGLVIASTDENDFGMDLSGDPSLVKTKGAAHTEVIKMLKDSQSGNVYLAIYHEIRTMPAPGGDEGAVTAVLILYLKPDLFLNALESNEQELGKSGEIFLVDQDMQLLTPLKHPLPDGTVPKPLDFSLNTKAARLAAEGNEGLLATTDYGGVPVLAAFRHLRINSELGWGMVVKRDQAEVFAPIRRLVFYFTLKAGVLLLLVFLLTYVIATRLSRPIKELSRMARRVEEGDLGARSLNEGNDELGILSNSFNSMVQRIQNWHSELEEQVNSRTSELLRLNEELEEEIEERSRIEEALRASEGRFRELLETVHQIAIILDRNGNITFCNDYLLNLSGWTRNEIMGREWFDLFIPEEPRDGVKALFMNAMKTLSLPAHYENPIVTRDGFQRTIVWDNTLLRDADGNLIGIASLGLDVTDHRNLEEQLRHSQKMEAIGQLAGGMAHDFNNMLTAIIGNCEFIKMKSSPDNPMQEYVDHILSVSGKAARLTHDLLAFSRKQFLSIKGIDANVCVRGAAKLLARVIGEDIDFRTILTEAKLPIMADEGQMEQVLVNLATNARDAMPNGGQLTIETRRIDLDTLSATLHGLEKPGNYAIIQVSDTGCGMDKATRERIFEPFFTTKEVGKGTGLGLAMVFGTIRQHGGYIDVYSEAGKGTVFKIYLPLSHTPSDENEILPELSLPGGNEILMVVEDNEDVRKSTVLILEEVGYRVIEAADGEEAMARFNEHRNSVNLVLLDVIMPKMNGKEVYDALCRLRPDIKVLFTSGYAADIIGKTLMMEEGLHLLQKPFAVSELLQRVRELLDNG
jgi:two-component system cell cycle sensor histidine kinase/response regulator CckA